MTDLLNELEACTNIDELPPAEVRARVAKDVLTLLRVGKLNGEGGTYVRAYFPQGLLEGDLKQQMGTMSTATVCGIGALFMAHVMRFDRFQVSGHCIYNSDECHRLSVGSNDIHRHLRGVFSTRTLAEVENAYESSAGCDCSACKKSELVAWARAYPSRTKRMVAIMENIVRNNGEFVMSDVR